MHVPKTKVFYVKSTGTQVVGTPSSKRTPCTSAKAAQSRRPETVWPGCDDALYFNLRIRVETQGSNKHVGPNPSLLNWQFPIYSVLKMVIFVSNSKKKLHGVCVCVWFPLLGTKG